jgi:hypothetical protein
MNNKEKRLEEIEKILNDLAPVRPPVSTKELSKKLVDICRSGGPEDCEKILLASGFQPARATKLVEALVKEFCERESAELAACLPETNPPEKRRTYRQGDKVRFVDESGLLKLREDFLGRLDDVFEPWMDHSDSALDKLVNGLPEPQRARLKALVLKVRLLPDSKSLHQLDRLTDDDRAFLGAIFPKYYSWTEREKAI